NIRVSSSTFEVSRSGQELKCPNCLPTCHGSSMNLDYDLHPTSLDTLTGSTGHLDVYHAKPGAIKYRRENSFTIMQLIGR
ncbi:hypothetical protein L9F63_005498, partial [Diploptera punctata]